MLIERALMRLSLRPMSITPQKTLIIVEDNRRLREQMVSIISASPDIRCVAALASAEEALEQIPRFGPDVVLMDIQLPVLSGTECVAQLKRVLPDLYIIMVTVHEDSDRIFDALRAGANGYLVKSDPPDQLLDAIRNVHGGGAPMSSQIARKVVRFFHAPPPSQYDKEILTAREQQVLGLLATGLIYKEIADKLDISVETVRTHVRNICQKMHVRNRIEAVAKRRP
jgi:DNA-binding NarL/FixJ family response regulator